jgi:hypothetical protein
MNIRSGQFTATDGTYDKYWVNNVYDAIMNRQHLAHPRQNIGPQPPTLPIAGPANLI